MDFATRGRWKPYIEWNGGATFTGSDAPPGRTATFNFTTSCEPGFMVHIHQNKGISLGVRLQHLSNAGTGFTNPSFDAVQVVVGYHWLKTGLLQQTMSAN